MIDNSNSQFVSRRSISFMFLLIIVGLIGSTMIFNSEIPLYGVIPVFILYILTTRTNLFGKRVRKQDDGSLKPE